MIIACAQPQTRRRSRDRLEEWVEGMMIHVWIEGGRGRERDFYRLTLEEEEEEEEEEGGERENPSNKKGPSPFPFAQRDGGGG